MLSTQLAQLLNRHDIIPEDDFERSQTAPQKGEIPKQSAVCIFIYPLKGEHNISLMLRNTYNGVHSNQISLPGGKMEKADISLEATALRECSEEIGAKPAIIVGKLPSIYIPPSNFQVTPFVGSSEKEPTFTLNEREVHTHIQLPIQILKILPIVYSNVSLSENKQLKVPSFVYQQNVIWGATAHILSCFRQVINELSTI